MGHIRFYFCNSFVWNFLFHVCEKHSDSSIFSQSPVLITFYRLPSLEASLRGQRLIRGTRRVHAHCGDKHSRLSEMGWVNTQTLQLSQVRCQGNRPRGSLTHRKFTKDALHCHLKPFFNNLFYFWLCWIFAALWGLSRIAAIGGRAFVAVCGLLTVLAPLAAGHRLQVGELQ